jgi:hypothetical protein
VLHELAGDTTASTRSASSRASFVRSKEFSPRADSPRPADDAIAGLGEGLGNPLRPRPDGHRLSLVKKSLSAAISRPAVLTCRASADRLVPTPARAKWDGVTRSAVSMTAQAYGQATTLYRRDFTNHPRTTRMRRKALNGRRRFSSAATTAARRPRLRTVWGWPAPGGSRGWPGHAWRAARRVSSWRAGVPGARSWPGG